MSKTRLEAFSDGVIAVLITILVLELRVPPGADWQALRSMLPSFLIYVLSFVFLGIYWNNHHHMCQAAERVNGKILWANLHLLFWLSLVPVVTAWMGKYPRSFWPAIIYGFIGFMAGAASTLLAPANAAANKANAITPRHSRDHTGPAPVALSPRCVAR